MRAHNRAASPVATLAQDCVLKVRSRSKDSRQWIPSVLAASCATAPKRFCFLNGERFGTIRAVQPLKSLFPSQQQEIDCNMQSNYS
jgi:hypothetical protein